MPSIANANIASSEFKADPFPFYAQLRSEAPVYRTKLPDKRNVWLVTRYNDVLTVLKDDRFGKDKIDARTPPWLPGMFKPLLRNMLDVDVPDHTRLRELVQKVCTARLIENLRERIQDRADKLLNQVQAEGRTDLIRDYAIPIPTTIIAEVLGVPAKDRYKFHRWSSTAISSTSSCWGLVFALPHGVAFLRYIRSLVKARRVHAEDDLVTALVRAEEGDQLSEDELVTMIFLLLVAGHETTVNLIGNGTLALLENPDQMDRLRDNPALIKAAVEELLRYNGPLETATERSTREDTTVAGVTVSRGELVFAVLASANRDEQQFQDADRLDLGREPNPHVAFGSGIHHGLGASLARIEGQIAIATLLRRIPNLKMAILSNALRWRRGLVLRVLEILPVTSTRGSGRSTGRST
jgi:cytochrome P450